MPDDGHLERVRIHDVFGYSDCIDFDYNSTPPSVISAFGPRGNL